MHQNTRQETLAVLSAVIGVIVAGGFSAHAQTDTNATTKLEQENSELRKRVDNLENILVKEGLKPAGSAAAADPPVSALTDITLSGFVSTSYFYDVGNHQDNHPAGYLWNTSLNSFTINKIKLTLASPAVDKTKWDAAYRVSFIWGQDAPITDTGSTHDPGFSWLREAYAELNIPIGTGLDVKAGELISLLNYESGDGGAANGNFSQGYQWYYTGNPPEGAVQLSYDFNDMFGLKLRLANGLYTGPVDTGSKTFLGGFYVKPDKKTSLAFLGFDGRQDFSPSWTIAGVSFIGSRQLFEQHNVSFATEFDYFRFSGFNHDGAGLASGASSGDWWSIGGWFSADLIPKLGATLRVEYLTDPTGFGTIYNSPPPGSDAAFPTAIYTTGAGQALTSVAFTLDYMATAALKIQPEIRWNHSSYPGSLNGERDQMIIGMGASYMF
jgi:hypothetical protein